MCHWSFFLPTLYCICERSGTIEKEKGGIETDRYVCVGRSLRDFESFGAEGEVKEIQGERPPIGMLMSKTSPTWALSRSLACVLCMWCYLTIFLLRLLCVVVDKRQQEKREGKKKKLCVRDLYRTHLSPSKLLLGRSYLSALVVKESLSLETFFGGGVSTHMTVFSFGIFFFSVGRNLVSAGVT